MLTNDDNQFDDDDAFPGYVQDTIDPGPWLLLSTTLFCLIVMLVLVPLAVGYTLMRRKRLNASAEAFVSSEKLPIDATFNNMVFSHKETLKIVKLAAPFTVSALTSSTFSNICLMLVSKHIGTKSVAAYALVQVLVGLTDGMLLGPISACTTLCSQAVGAGNSFLPGQYIQLAITFYLIGNIPVIIFWSFYMYEMILYLEWGDTETALYGQQFVRIYIWSYVLGGISNGIWQLLEVAGHSFEGTVVSIIWGATNAVVIAAIVTTRESNLTVVGLVFIGTSVLYITLTIAIATLCGWFTPFWRGLFGGLALRNTNAVKVMLKQAVPLCWGSLVSNAEWAILTIFASHMGPAEVAAWAILGSIWDIFYSVTAGIGDAAEIRVAYHLGNNHPTMARLCAYKSLMIGVVVASLVSIVFFSLQSQIPKWFTTDKTLQAMLAEMVPFVGLANLTMTFGMQCWSILGAQGKYKLATWISFISSWGVSMPLAAIFVYAFQLDLQGLTSAVVCGYLTTGASLSYVLLSTDWQKVSRKIREQHSSANMSEMTSEEHDEELYATVKANRGVGTKTNINRQIRNNVRLLMLPAGTQPGLVIGTLNSHEGIYILEVHHWSPLYHRVKHGDAILALDEIDVSHEDPDTVADRLKLPSIFDRQIVVKLCMTDDDHTQTDASTNLSTISDIESGSLLGEPTTTKAKIASMIAMPLGMHLVGAQTSLYDGEYNATETALTDSAKEPFRQWYRTIFGMAVSIDDGAGEFETQNSQLQGNDMNRHSEGTEYHEMLDMLAPQEISTYSGIGKHIDTVYLHEKGNYNDSTNQIDDADVVMLSDEDSKPTDATVDVIANADDNGRDSTTEVTSDAGGVSRIAFTPCDDGKEHDEMSVGHTSSEQADIVPLSDNLLTANDLNTSVCGVVDTPDNIPGAIDICLSGNAFTSTDDDDNNQTGVVVSSENLLTNSLNAGIDGALGTPDDSVSEATTDATVDVMVFAVNVGVDAGDAERADDPDSMTEVTMAHADVELDDDIADGADVPDSVTEVTMEATLDVMACADVGVDQVDGGADDDHGPDSMNEATMHAMVDVMAHAADVRVAEGVDDPDSGTVATT
jgi:multidrug resistance protein, MATE family